MKRFGMIKVTPHLIDDSNWPEIENELKKVFTEQGRSFDEMLGIWKIVGKSDLFEEVTEGCAVPCYDAVFKTVDRKPKFIQFNKQ